jgi:hypothetical protein
VRFVFTHRRRHARRTQQLELSQAGTSSTHELLLTADTLDEADAEVPQPASGSSSTQIATPAAAAAATADAHGEQGRNDHSDYTPVDVLLLCGSGGGAAGESGSVGRRTAASVAAKTPLLAALYAQTYGGSRGQQTQQMHGAAGNTAMEEAGDLSALWKRTHRLVYRAHAAPLASAATTAAACDSDVGGWVAGGCAGSVDAAGAAVASGSGMRAVATEKATAAAQGGSSRLRGEKRRRDAKAKVRAERAEPEEIQAAAAAITVASPLPSERTALDATLRRVWSLLRLGEVAAAEAAQGHGTCADVQALLSLLLLLRLVSDVLHWDVRVGDGGAGGGSDSTVEQAAASAAAAAAVERGGSSNAKRECQWHATRLGARMLTAMHEPAVVAAGLLPAWCAALARSFPEVLPYQAREHLFYCSAFGTTRAVHALQQWEAEGGGAGNTARGGSGGGGSGDGGGGGALGTLRKDRVVIGREPVLQWAERVMRVHADRPSVLDIGFHAEKGFGLGVTAEWYTLVAAKLQCPVENASVRMWQQGDEQAVDPTASLVTSGGLFPATMDPAHCPTAVTDRFRLLGHMTAKALQDRRVLPCVLSAAFLKAAQGHSLVLEDVAGVAALGTVPAFLTSLRQAAAAAAAGKGSSGASSLDDVIPIGCYFVVRRPHHNLTTVRSD